MGRFAQIKFLLTKISYRILILTLFFVTSSSSIAQTTYMGGRGLYSVFSAETIQPGSIIINSYYSAFIRGSDETGNGIDQNINFSLTYGISNSFELTAQLVPYQSLQKSNWFSPGNTQIGFKWRLPFISPGFITGVRGFIRIPTAKNSNPPFEPYSTGKIAWSILGLLTLDMTHSFAKIPLKIHSNIGYLDQNAGTIFSADETDQLLIGFGFKIPLRPFILYSEYTSEIFLHNDLVGFGDNSMRLTHGLKFKGPFKTIVDLGINIGLSRNRGVYSTSLLHDYADWKIVGGVTRHFTTRKVFGHGSQTAKMSRKKEEEILKEIQKKREQANKDLEKTHKKLKKGDTKKKL